MRRRLTDDDNNNNSNNDKVIDLLSIEKEAQDESKVYICSECGHDLVYDKTYRFRNPFGGEGYFCSNINKCTSFSKIQDISFVKLKVKPRSVVGAISNLRDASQETLIETIAEDKGLMLDEDDYEKYDPEGDADERMKMEGFHIIESRIELVDSSGMNRTIVKRDQM